MTYSPGGASTTGGYTPGKYLSAASTNGVALKNGPGTLGFIAATNTNANARFLKLYDKASAPVVGTDVPVLTVLIPGTAAGAGTNLALPAQGLAFANGIAMAITAAAADNDTTAIGASEVIVNYGTK